MIIPQGLLVRPSSEYYYAYRFGKNQGFFSNAKIGGSGTHFRPTESGSCLQLVIGFCGSAVPKRLPFERRRSAWHQSPESVTGVFRAQPSFNGRYDAGGRRTDSPEGYSF